MSGVEGGASCGERPAFRPVPCGGGAGIAGTPRRVGRGFVAGGVVPGTGARRAVARRAGHVGRHLLAGGDARGPDASGCLCRRPVTMLPALVPPVVASAPLERSGGDVGHRVLLLRVGLPVVGIGGGLHAWRDGDTPVPALPRQAALTGAPSASPGWYGTRPAAWMRHRRPTCFSRWRFSWARFFRSGNAMRRSPYVPPCRRRCPGAERTSARSPGGRDPGGPNASAIPKRRDGPQRNRHRGAADVRAPFRPRDTGAPRSARALGPEGHPHGTGAGPARPLAGCGAHRGAVDSPCGPGPFVSGVPHRGEGARGHPRLTAALVTFGVRRPR